MNTVKSLLQRKNILWKKKKNYFINQKCCDLFRLCETSGPAPLRDALEGCCCFALLYATRPTQSELWVAHCASMHSEGYHKVNKQCYVALQSQTNIPLLAYRKTEDPASNIGTTPPSVAVLFALHYPATIPRETVTCHLHYCSSRSSACTHTFTRARRVPIMMSVWQADAVEG